jgi:predicted ATP-grasp superfamily ATP-dependent carboligase
LQAKFETLSMAPSDTANDRRTGEVLVLGTDDRVVLAVARSLGRRKLRVHLGWCAPDSIAIGSKYVAQVHQIPPYSPYDDAWKRALLDLLEKEPFDLVIPCNDSTVVPLQNHRADFERFPFLHLLPQETFDVAFDKFKTYELARSLGISVPQGATVFSAEEAEDLLQRLKPPVVLKPRATVTRETVGASNVVKKAWNVQELRELLQLPSFQNGVLIQENFVGRGAGVELLACQGEVLFAFQHARIHETTEVGSSYRKSVPLDPELLDASRKLMKALNYTGVAMAEFIVNPETGRWVFLEINGRFWGSLPLAVAAGADFPYYLYQMWVEGKREFAQDYEIEVYCRNLLLDYRGRSQWAKTGGLGRVAVLGKTAYELLTRDHLDSFVIDDLKPGFLELGRLLGTLTAKIRNRLRPPHAQPGQDGDSQPVSVSAKANT